MTLVTFGLSGVSSSVPTTVEGGRGEGKEVRTEGRRRERGGQTSTGKVRGRGRTDRCLYQTQKISIVASLLDLELPKMRTLERKTPTRTVLNP